MKTDWIKTSDRAPTQFPVWNTYVGGPVKLAWQRNEMMGGSTHWADAHDDIPEPPRKETQEASDLVALGEWASLENIQPLFTVRKTWLAACAYTRRDERAEVAKMLPDVSQASWLTLRDAIEAIRARCEGDRK